MSNISLQGIHLMSCTIPTSLARTVRRLLQGVVLVGMACGATIDGAAAAYVLQAGDTLELSIASLPTLHDKAMIDVDGRVHLPLLAPLQVAGLTLDQVLDQLRLDLPKKAFRQIQPDGRDGFISIDPGEISLEIADYRPVYVRGDVDKPGEIHYRPGLSVRQAIALVGGYDTMHFRMENPFLQSSDLRAQHQSLWIEYARSRAHALLLDAEIKAVAPPDLTTAMRTPLSRDLLNNIVSIETQSRAVQNADFQKELDYLHRGANDAQTQLTALLKPRDEAQRSEADDAAYKKSLGELLQKGVIAHDRITDQQRSLLESTQRFLDYTQRIEELEKSRNDFNRQAERLENQHRANLLKDLQDANTQTANVDARLQAVDEKLAYTGTIRSQLVRGDGHDPDISVTHAETQGAAETSTANEDSLLSPGDTVEVSLRSMQMPKPNLN